MKNGVELLDENGGGRREREEMMRLGGSRKEEGMKGVVTLLRRSSCLVWAGVICLRCV